MTGTTPDLNALLAGTGVFHHGIERESLRTTPDGRLAMTPHPDSLGSKLTHPMITTDFSESQLELITPVANSSSEALEILRGVHQFVHENLGDELLWPASMPCQLPADNDIPLAQYGVSHGGRLKTTYRNGLGLRYGRSMQTICAIHYNFSFAESFWQRLATSEAVQDSATYRTARYFDLMRNFRRWSWLPLYLFGASPAVANSFVTGRAHTLEQLSADTLFMPYATSLRNGSLGYQSDIQANLLKVCYNSLESYVETLCRGICTPHPDYAFSGDAVQINRNILQSEAEFYTTIRAKRVPPKGSNFLRALGADGVEYIEVRLLDSNPFKPLGLDHEEMAFIDTFLVHSLLTDSPYHDDPLCAAVRDNLLKTVYEGRREGLQIDDQGTPRELRRWGTSLVTDMQPVAAALDVAQNTTIHQDSLTRQLQKLDDPRHCPSAQVLAELEQQDFVTFGLRQARALRAQLLDQSPDAALRAKLQQASNESHTLFAAADTPPDGSFTDYLASVQQQYDQLLADLT